MLSRERVPLVGDSGFRAVFRFQDALCRQHLAAHLVGVVTVVAGAQSRASRLSGGGEPRSLRGLLVEIGVKAHPLACFASEALVDVCADAAYLRTCGGVVRLAGTPDDGPSEPSLTPRRAAERSDGLELLAARVDEPCVKPPRLRLHPRRHERERDADFLLPLNLVRAARRNGQRRRAPHAVRQHMARPGLRKGRDLPCQAVGVVYVRGQNGENRVFRRRVGRQGATVVRHALRGQLVDLRASRDWLVLVLGVKGVMSARVVVHHGREQRVGVALGCVETVFPRDGKAVAHDGLVLPVAVESERLRPGLLVAVEVEPPVPELARRAVGLVEVHRPRSHAGDADENAVLPLAEGFPHVVGREDRAGDHH